MKKSLYAFTLVVAFAFFTVNFSSTGCSSGGPEENDSIRDSSLTATINNSYAIPPADMRGFNQASADTFSWLSFIAMCWPADPNTCGPDTAAGKSILNGTGPVVWETYLSDEQVFVAPTSQPAPWCSAFNTEHMKHVPEAALALGREKGVTRFIHMSSKSPHGLDQASGGPLVDQYQRFVRYEVRMNQDQYNYIMAETLWTKSGQQRFFDTTDNLNFPVHPLGAMEFKAAWKVLGAHDDPSKFYTIQAIVYNDEKGDPIPASDPSHVTLGLVGLHISHKTASQTNWIWSTFEHVDNLTTLFYDSSCTTCPVNASITGPPMEFDTTTGLPLHHSTQVTRINEVADPYAPPINAYFQNMLKGSVWANYQLISTQWTQFNDPTPKFLANSVMETYLQGAHPASDGGVPVHDGQLFYKSPLYKPFSTSSSCMGCHYTSADTVGANISRFDFSFITMIDAQ